MIRAPLVLAVLGLAVVGTAPRAARAAPVEFKIVDKGEPTPLKRPGETTSYGTGGDTSTASGGALTEPEASRGPHAFGGPRRFRALVGTCVTHATGQYEYRVCPFHNVTQRDTSSAWNAFHGVLGVWGEWRIDANAHYEALEFTNGLPCGSGKERSVVVRLECLVEAAGGGAIAPPVVDSFEEPETCAYTAVLRVPQACGDLSVATAEAEAALDGGLAPLCAWPGGARGRCTPREYLAGTGFAPPYPRVVAGAGQAAAAPSAAAAAAFFPAAPSDDAEAAAATDGDAAATSDDGGGGGGDDADGGGTAAGGGGGGGGGEAPDSCAPVAAQVASLREEVFQMRVLLLEFMRGGGGKSAAGGAEGGGKDVAHHQDDVAALAGELAARNELLRQQAEELAALESAAADGGTDA